MRYWDASALVPLVIAEPATSQVQGWLHEDPQIVTWVWTQVELVSAIERRALHGEISRSERRNALDQFTKLAEAWDEVIDPLPVRQKAKSLLARHSLRAADAAQLAAALLIVEEDPASLTFVCLDQRLSMAAEREGLRVLD